MNDTQLAITVILAGSSLIIGINNGSVLRGLIGAAVMVAFCMACNWLGRRYL